MKSIAIVTGASSGLGVEYARALDKLPSRSEFPDKRQVKDVNKERINFCSGLYRPDEIWITARRRERLEKLAQDLNTPVRIFAGDICDEELRASIVDELKTKEDGEELKISYLVNSAGRGKTGDFENLSHDHVEGLLDLNIKSLTLLCYEVLPYMSKGSFIFNVASVAAFLPQKNFSIYAASKAYVLNFSRALDFDLAKKGIRVIAVCPNPMETEFFDQSSEKSVSAIKNIGIEKPDSVVNRSFKLARRRLFNWRVSVSHPLAKGIHLLSKLLPTSFIMWLEEKIGI